MNTLRSIIIVLGFVSTGLGQPVQPEALKIVPQDAAPGSRFGYSVALDEGWLAVSALLDDEGGNNAGAVYMFRSESDDWVEQDKLTGSSAGDWFGYDVALAGEVLVVGAQQVDDAGADAGAVDVFRFDGMTWNFEVRLIPPDLGAGDLFGHSVDTDGQVIVAAAERHDNRAPNAGAVYVYRYDDANSIWLAEDKLEADDAGAHDFFGHDVALDADILVVGAERDNVAGVQNAGSVYAFEYSALDGQWHQEARLTAPTPEPNDFFGHAVAWSEPCLIVGAFFDDDRGTDSGAAYVFRRTGPSQWKLEQALRTSDAAAEHRFASAVAIEASRIVCGAEGWPGTASERGAAYGFSDPGQGYLPHVRYRGLTTTTGARLGGAVSLNGNRVAVGADGDNEMGTEAGAVLIFDAPLRPVIRHTTPR